MPSLYNGNKLSTYLLVGVQVRGVGLQLQQNGF